MRRTFCSLAVAGERARRAEETDRFYVSFNKFYFFRINLARGDFSIRTMSLARSQAPTRAAKYESAAKLSARMQRINFQYRRVTSITFLRLRCDFFFSRLCDRVLPLKMRLG